MLMTKRAKVALLIDTATTWGSGLIEGIAEYAHAHQHWQCFLGPRGKYDRSILPDNWDGDGVIACADEPGTSGSAHRQADPCGERLVVSLRRGAFHAALAMR